MIVYLYVKRHNVTGLLYFGKTTKNPLKYNGSGKYWKNHLSQHGKDVETLVVWEFEHDDPSLVEFAEGFSETYNIVKSSEWANLIVENGLDGAPVGHEGYFFSDEQRKHFSKLSRERWNNPDFVGKMSEAQRKTYLSGRKPVTPKWDAQRREEHSKRMKEISNDTLKIERFTEIAKLPKTKEHRNKISTALKGKEKSNQHKETLAWNRIKKYNPSIVFECYEDFTKECIRLYEIHKNKSKVARILNVGFGAVDSVISNEYLLKEK